MDSLYASIWKSTCLTFWPMLPGPCQRDLWQPVKAPFFATRPNIQHLAAPRVEHCLQHLKYKNMAQNYQQYVKFTYKVVSSRQAWEGNQGWHLGACTLVPSKLRPIQRCWSTSNNQLLGASWPERWVNTRLKYLWYFYVCKICLFTSWKYKIWVSSMTW